MTKEPNPMTNPTPLTAEAVAKKIFKEIKGSAENHYIVTWPDSFRKDALEDTVANIEAYAAQQNAELVAENKRLNEMASNRAQAIELYSNDVATCANRCKELQAENERLKQQLAWQPIETAPKDGTFILLAGDSGYRTTPLRVEVCAYQPDYRPLQPWVNHSCDSFLDGGGEPTHWMPLPQPPKEAT